MKKLLYVTSLVLLMVSCRSNLSKVERVYIDVNLDDVLKKKEEVTYKHVKKVYYPVNWNYSKGMYVPVFNDPTDLGFSLTLYAIPCSKGYTFKGIISQTNFIRWNTFVHSTKYAELKTIKSQYQVEGDKGDEISVELSTGTVVLKIK